MWHWSGFITSTSLQHFHLLPAPGCGWWATGNFNVGYSCALHVPHILLSLDRPAAPPHTPSSPTCSGFCVCPWRWWHRPKLWLPSLRTLPCYVYHNYIYGAMPPSAEIGQPFCGPPNAVLQFWMYLLEVGMVIDFRVRPIVTSMGNRGCLLYMRKYGLMPMAEFWVQL